MRTVLRGLAVLVLLGIADSGAAADVAEPAKVIIGAYVNQILDLSFRDRRYTIDFWIWFRWKPQGGMADYKPLDSFEIINGRVDYRTSVVEKQIGDVNYASARITASISQPWDLAAFPLDNHRLRIHVEDSKRVTSEMVFELDSVNSRLGDEINLSGWIVTFFDAGVANKSYQTNYGDISLPTRDWSEFSRFTFSMDLRRENHEAAIKLLTTMILAPLVAFAAFLIKPVDVNTRFGVGVGALFAVATSAVIVASAVPDSTALTAADKMHMVSMSFIFASLVQSAISMKWEARGQVRRSVLADRICLVAFPLLFALLCARIVSTALESI